MIYSNFKMKSPYFIISFGVILFLTAATHHANELSAVNGMISPVVAFLLDGLPALVLAYAGYRLTGIGLSSEDRWQIWVWCLCGATLLMTIMGFSILIRAFEGRVIGEALFPLLIATEAGGIAGVVGGYQTGRARTEARRAQSASDTLRERTRQLKGVLDAVEAAIWIRDTDSRFVLVNHTFRTLFDIEEETEVAGKLPEEVVLQEIAEGFRENDQQVLETEESIEIKETIETDHGRRTFLTRITPLFEDGDLYATCGIASDITEQKEYQRTIEQQNERLDQFASVVSHDLRNPLNVARGRLELAQEECDSEQLEKVDRALDRMDTLIEDVLLLARGGDNVTEVEPVKLQTIIKNCWANVDTGSATIVSHINRTVHADGSRLKRVFENLIRNAIEHNDDDVAVTIGELDDGFYIEDDGLGVSEDVRNNVFDAGYTATNKGTGFGLNIVKKGIMAHGWDIKLTEATDGGARFEITGVTFE